MHVHTLQLHVPHSTRVTCTGCDIQLRLATYDEAVFIDITDGFAPEGPMVGFNNCVVVPADFSLFSTPEEKPLS